MFRGLYYASRLLATQKIKNNHYRHPKKVYSVWIIADKNTNSKSSISNVYPIIDNMFGSYLIKEDYKLINVVMINIGIDVEKVIKDNNIFSDLFRLIRLLIVGGDITNETRSKELIEHYDILMTKEDIDTMHWSNDIEESGFNRGELFRKTTDIQNIMSSLNVNFDKAAKALKFNETDKKEVLEYLNKQKNS